MKKAIAVVAVVLAAWAFQTEGTTFQTVQKVHTVQPGDTLWDIAQTYLPQDDRCEYILQFKEEIVQGNPFLKARNGEIYPGDKLTITLHVKRGES